jgi:hypothetical protein
MELLAVGAQMLMARLQPLLQPLVRPLASRRWWGIVR